MGTLLQDLRYAVRKFAKKPGITIAVVVTLGLGIGANTAVFSVLNALVLRPLPYEDPDRLVVLSGTRDGTIVHDGMVYVNSGYGLYFHMPGNLLLAFGVKE